MLYVSSYVYMSCDLKYIFSKIKGCVKIQYKRGKEMMKEWKEEKGN